MNRLSVIIPSRTWSNLKPCVKAIYRNEPDIEVIVVDDGVQVPISNIPEIIEAYAALRRFALIEGTKPFVFARNCNLAINDRRGNDVILCNDDCLLESPGGFSLLKRAQAEHPEYGIIGATTNLTGQPLQRRLSASDPRHGLREVPHIAFVCVYIPRSTIERVGLLDERYCLGYGSEDRDYCEQVARAGLKIGVHDGCFVDHASLRSTYRGDPHAPGDISKNHALLLEKWGGKLVAG